MGPAAEAAAASANGHAEGGIAPAAPAEGE
jgi:hypothetical protein